MKRFAPALALVALILATAPAIRTLQRFVFERLPAVGLLRGAFLLAGVALLVAALWRIRERRLLRYAGLAVSAVLVAAMVVGFRQGQIEVDIVERIHIFEYGFLAFLLYWALHPKGGLELLVLPVLGVVIAGTLDEWWQWYVPQRTGEVRDVALNAAAGVAGLIFSLSILPPGDSPWRSHPGSGRRILRTSAVAVLVVGLFVHFAHLGHWVEHPEVGSFRSWFTAEELRELAEKRRTEWAEEPPVELGTYSHEDYYLTEAGWHFHHRNASLEYDTPYLAWQANLVLETFYAPFLDTLGHRWPPELRREVRSRVVSKMGEPDPAGYVSPVLEHRIWTRPSKPAWLAGVTLIALGLWLSPAWFRSEDRVG